MEVTVTVTKETYQESRERLEFGKDGRAASCPVAVATQKALGLGNRQVYMGNFVLSLYAPEGEGHSLYSVVPPDLAKEVVKAFDLSGQPEVYGSFTLSLPDDLLPKLKGEQP